jgi:hypothetical protein
MRRYLLVAVVLAIVIVLVVLRASRKPPRDK